MFRSVRPFPALGLSLCVFFLVACQQGGPDPLEVIDAPFKVAHGVLQGTANVIGGPTVPYRSIRSRNPAPVTPAVEEAPLGDWEDDPAADGRFATVSLAGSTAAKEIAGLSVGQSWSRVRNGHQFQSVDLGSCGGEEFLRSYKAKIDKSEVFVFVAKDTILRIQVVIPHEFGKLSTRQSLDLVVRRHGDALSRDDKKGAIYYTPIAVSDISDVNILVYRDSYQLNFMDARAFVESILAARRCVYDAAFNQTLAAVKKIAAESMASSASSGGGGRGPGGAWGALAIDRNAGTKFGYSHDYPDKNAAVARAERECNSRGGARCTVVITYSGGCAAYAASQSDGSAYGWGQGDSETGAKSRALSECRARGSSCEIRDWSCADR